VTFEVVDEVFEAARLRWRTPGIAYGVVHGGALVHMGGLGTLSVGRDATPDAASVFRIASMTKSFTSAAVMGLVERGVLDLDRPVEEIEPRLATWRGPTGDGPPLSLRRLMWMESGLPSDDPWADRHLDATEEEMDAWLAAGASFAWTPGTRFEYANLGWGLVGRVVERATGTRVQDHVRELLAELGMTSTTWTREELPAEAAVASGSEWRDGAWISSGPTLGDGAIAPMGGLWSTVRDLASWVSFFLDAFPARDDAERWSISRAARREMQQLRRIDDAVSVRPRPSGPSRTIARGYGIGLAVMHDPKLGYVVGHSGGLPGFGSHMRWLPERGIGVIALGNSTYAAMSSACAWALDALADAGVLPAIAASAPPALTRMARRVTELLDAWDDDAAAGLFADNVDLDEPLERRRAAAGELRERLGRFALGEVHADTPASATFRLADDRLEVDIQLNAEVPTRVQWLGLTDRTRPGDDPVISDPAMLRGLPRCVVAVLRPVGDVADRFAAMQGELLDRFPQVAWSPPGVHCTLASWGSSASPLDEAAERTATDVVRSWAEAAPPLTLAIEGLAAFDGPEERVPVMRIRATEGLRAALRDLRARGEAAGLAPATSHEIAPGGWIFHLSLAYADRVDDPLWDEIVAWTARVAAPDAVCEAAVIDLLAYGSGPERSLGRSELAG